MSDIKAIVWDETVAKQLARLPKFIRRKFFAWVDAVKLAGIRAVRQRPGFHDEPLKGNRLGQRSVRLNRDYRIIYVEWTDGRNKALEVIEVIKHAY